MDGKHLTTGNANQRKTLKSLNHVVDNIMDMNEIAIWVFIGVVAGVIAGIIVYHYSQALYPKEPKLEITGIEYVQIPTSDLGNLPSLKIIKNNKTIVNYSAASIPYIYIEVKNAGDKIAIIDKLTIEVLRAKPISPAVTPTWNYTIVLGTREILCRLNLSSWTGSLNISPFLGYVLEPPYSMDFELTPHFKVKPNDVDAFGIYIDTDSSIDTSEYLIKIIIHYDGKEVEINPIWIKVLKPSVVVRVPT